MSFSKHDRAFLKGARDFRVDTKFQDLAIKEYLSSLDCPRALTAWLMYSSNEHGQLASLEFSPEDYNGVKAVRDAYAATKFLSKFEKLNLGYDLEEVALAKFSEFEDLCRRTNHRFKNLGADPKFHGSAVYIHNRCVQKISNVLGQWSAEELFEYPDWGPGASTLIRRRDASSAIKFQCETGITRDLHALVTTQILQQAFPLWAEHLSSSAFPNYQVGNKVVTVAKDAKANRVIAIEPGINLFFQKSVGEMIRRRLLFVGVDTRNQGKNQRAALLASINGRAATLDLSSASDSIALTVVEALIPHRWFMLLDSCRSQYGKLKNQLIRWEKFSSMGNGFTFPLQSLIFYGIACAVTEYVNADQNMICVYGDDIIVPTEAVELFSAMLDFYGFRLNETKSFVRSAFRESCGSHYFAGFDVKPIYLKKEISSLPSIFKFGNAIRRSARSRNLGLGCDRKLRSVHRLLVSRVPKPLRLSIPDQLGDGGFVCNFDEAVPERARHGIEGYRVKHLVTKDVYCPEERLGYLLAELWRIDSRGLMLLSPRLPPRLIAHYLGKELANETTALSGSFAGRNRISSSRQHLNVVRSLVPQWTDFGPWSESVVDHLV